ncbi:hypothetical protein PRIPAC_88403, partial [Pristionchus pacificus]|uniref:Uncharacterized protein n=1 Tax=Pristionchus pacificus TaxID=54126 RepID=A0A2A6CXX3_PRIPA
MTACPSHTAEPRSGRPTGEGRREGRPACLASQRTAKDTSEKRFREAARARTRLAMARAASGSSITHSSPDRSATPEASTRTDDRLTCKQNQDKERTNGEAERREHPIDVEERVIVSLDMEWKGKRERRRERSLGREGDSISGYGMEGKEGKEKRTITRHPIDVEERVIVSLDMEWKGKRERRRERSLGSEGDSISGYEMEGKEGKEKRTITRHPIDVEVRVIVSLDMKWKGKRERRRERSLGSEGDSISGYEMEGKEGKEKRTITRHPIDVEVRVIVSLDMKWKGKRERRRERSLGSEGDSISGYEMEGKEGKEKRTITRHPIDVEERVIVSLDMEWKGKRERRRERSLGSEGDSISGYEMEGKEGKEKRTITRHPIDVEVRVIVSLDMKWKGKRERRRERSLGSEGDSISGYEMEGKEGKEKRTITRHPIDVEVRVIVSLDMKWKGKRERRRERSLGSEGDRISGYEMEGKEGKEKRTITRHPIDVEVRVIVSLDMKWKGKRERRRERSLGSEGDSISGYEMEGKEGKEKRTITRHPIDVEVRVIVSLDMKWKGKRERRRERSLGSEGDSISGYEMEGKEGKEKRTITRHPIDVEERVIVSLDMEWKGKRERRRERSLGSEGDSISGYEMEGKEGKEKRTITRHPIDVEVRVIVSLDMKWKGKRERRRERSLGSEGDSISGYEMEGKEGKEKRTITR